MSQKPYIDIGFVIPLLEEFNRLTVKYPVSEEFTDGAQYYATLDLSKLGLTAAAFLQDDMGKASATRATEKLLAKHDVGVIIVVGIAGGLSGDVAIGDVCFTGTVIDVLENAKQSDSSKGKQKTEFNTKFYNTDSLLTFGMNYSQIGKDVKGAFETWQLEAFYAAQQLVPGEFIGRKDKNEVVGIPQIHDGSIVCGAVSKSEIYNSNLKSIDRKVLAIETEAGGVFHSAQTAGVPAIAVRGICDYADKNKSKLEDQTSGSARKIAADNAISFIGLQMGNPQFVRYLENRRQAHTNAGPDLLTSTEAISSADALSAVRADIHEKLTILSPQYHGKEAGYRLPLPRIKMAQGGATVSKTLNRVEEIGILEAIAKNHVTLVDVPRNYPDNSLPWVIATELCFVELDGKQAIPIVISGDSIVRPKGRISALSSVDLEQLNQCEDARPIVIITEFRPSSRGRIEFLKEQMSLYSEARFVIVNKNDPGFSAENELVLTVGAVKYKVCDISFFEMTQFFERAFNMADQEAGVTALRLQAMFQKFKLSVHPTYFAGVAGEVLNSLLRANRRAELLQLAVGGFLSFVVASDTSATVLSRTTREEFLKTLAFEKNVEKRSISRQDLIGMAEKFAEDRDYDIDPIEFIKTFQDRAIIHFDTGGVQISLPFVESYLLAAELYSRPDQAKKYFDLNSADFDFATFDIYSELGPSAEIVDDAISALTDARAILHDDDDQVHILLTDEIRPAMLERPGKIAELEDKLRQAFDDVTSSRPNNKRKQSLLDLAARVEGHAKHAEEEARTKQRKDKEDFLERIDYPMRVWSASTILLGSGSERLGRDPKRELALGIIGTGSWLIDRILRSFPRIEMDDLRTELRKEETLRDIFGISADQELDPTLIEFVSTIIDAYEFSLLGLPMSAIFGELANAAGQTVLRPSVSSIKTTGLMENLFTQVWAAEIDAGRNKAELLSAIRDLPPVAFLRHTLSSHFMNRVFWHHWDMANRVALLDAAIETLAPLSQTIDKGKVQRQLRASAGED